MKYVVVLPDGVADTPINELGDKTPLEVAKHPNMDWIAREGITGLAHTIPQGFPPGSDVGCMSVFGYDPRKYYTGRAPLEAAAQGDQARSQRRRLPLQHRLRRRRDPQGLFRRAHRK